MRIHLEEGSVFQVSKRWLDVSSDNTVSMLIENLDDNDVNAYILAIEIVSTGEFAIDIYHDVTVASYGTELYPQNLNLANGTQSTIKVYTDGSYSGGTRFIETVSPGGSGQKAFGSLAEVGEMLILSPGHNMLIVGTNMSSAAEHMSIRCLWWEYE